MNAFLRQSIWGRRLIAGLATLVLVAVGSGLQNNILKVDANPDVLLISHLAIPFGTVFPGEILDETYTVTLDLSVDDDIYQTEIQPLEGVLNLCPFLEIIPIDNPDEGDAFASSTLTRPGDTVDSWQVRLTVPGIEGHIAQDHDGGIVVEGGDYGCKIIITTDREPGEPTLDLQKSAEYDAATGEITYTIDWTVGGEGTIEDLTITDQVPAGTAFISADNGGVHNLVTNVVTWNLGDIVAPDSGSVEMVVDSFFDVFYDAVLDYQPGASAGGEIRVLDATTDSPVPPDLEGAVFPVLDLLDLSAIDGAFVNTVFVGDFGAGVEGKTVDDEARTFVAMGDGGEATVGHSNGMYLGNGAGDDFILYETPGGRDPSCVSVTALDDTVYPLAANPACENEQAFKFQDTGDADAFGVALNLDSLGVPAGTQIKSVTVYDIEDGHILGTTGSPGYDLDALTPADCLIENSATAVGTFGQGEISATATADVEVETAICEPEVPPRVLFEKSGEYDAISGEITFTINYDVAGVGTLHDVVIEDTIPFGTTYLSSNPLAILGPGGVLTWDLGDLVAPTSSSVEFTVQSFFDVFFDDVLDYQPGVSAESTIRVQDATINSPVPPDIEGAPFPITVIDLSFKDAVFVNTSFFGDFGSGDEFKTVDDEAQTFVSMGDGGSITLDVTGLSNGAGDDVVIFETPNVGGRDPACVSVEALDATIYPLAPSAACGGLNAFKFQDVGAATEAGVPVNLDSLGVPADEAIIEMTIYDLLDGHILGTTGSPGFDFDTVGQVGEFCEVENTAFFSSPDLEQDLEASTIVSNPLCLNGTEENGDGNGDLQLQTLGSTGGSGGGGGGGIADPNLNTPNNGDGGSVLGEGTSASNGSSPGNGAGAGNPPTVAGATELPRTGITISVLLILLGLVTFLSLRARAKQSPARN